MRGCGGDECVGGEVSVMSGWVVRGWVVSGCAGDGGDERV